MISGDNSILQKATDAKEQTNIAQIKEQAEMVKLGMQIDTYSRANSEKLKQNALVSAIHDEFEGSSCKGSKITTADKSYDIIVDEDLKITVLKHQNADVGTIILSYEANPQQNGVYITVTPTTDNENNTPSYDVWAQGELDKLSTDPTTRQTQLEEMFVEADKYYRIMYDNPTDEEILEMRSITSFTDWMEFIGDSSTNINDLYNSYGSEYDSVEEMMIDWQYIKPQEYEEKYEKKVTISCGEESYTINPLQQSYVEFWIENGGEYTISATSSDGSTGETFVNVKIIYPTSATINAGNTTTLTVQGKNETLVWNSSNTSIATVENGTITGIEEGTINITVTNQNANAVSNICEIQVIGVYSEQIKEKLKINLEGETDGEKSPFVKYNGEIYRVLYDASSPYGIEIISANPLKTVTLGKNDSATLADNTNTTAKNYLINNNVTLVNNSSSDKTGTVGTFDRSRWSYNNAIATLNYEAQSYLTNLADRARCVGSDPNNPNNKNTNKHTNTYSYFKSYKNQFEASEQDGTNNWLNFVIDKTQLDNLGILKYNDTTISNSYWLASRYALSASQGAYFGISNISSGGNFTHYDLCEISSSGSTTARGTSRGLRPVIHLKTNIKIKNDGNDGLTEATAYTLE